MELQYVGKSVERTDVTRKVTGALRFADDMVMPGMLYAKLCRSEYAHARIGNIDVKKAKSLPGVVDVITGYDLPKPGPMFGPVSQDQPLLATGKVKFHGEPLAVVLSDEEEVAEAAVKLILAEYSALPHITTIEAALKDDAPLIHDELPGPSCSSNIHSAYEYKWGDVETAKKDCTHHFINTYEFPMIHHSTIEPFCVLAYPEDGGVVIKSPIQHPFVLRRVVAVALGLSLSKVRVVPTDIGGGFGGKGYSKYEPLVAYLALRTGRPVKLALTMNDGFFTSRRLSCRAQISTGFDASGCLVYQDVVADYLIGAYADAAPRVVAKAGYLGLCGPYRIPNARITAKAIYSNTVPATAMRGFGMPQMVWAIESQMNEASQFLGLDTLAIRLKNLPDKGEALVPGDTPVDGDWKQGVQRAADLLGWNTPKAKNTGRGIAIGIKNPIPCAVSNALVKLHADDSVTVSIGTTEMGQGARTVMAQIAAEQLGVAISNVTVIMGDTGAVPFDLCTAASRSTVSMGNAVIYACQDVLSQLREMAHELKLFDRSETVEISGGLVKGCNQVISYPDLLKQYLGFSQGEVVGRGVFKGTKGTGTSLGGMTDFWEIIFQAAEVQIDTQTGKVTVTKFVNVSDLGKAINPLQAKAQEEGGSVMGMGHTLLEQMIYDDSGKLQNGSPLDYRIPTTLDVPSALISDFLENQDGPGPYGAKGLGESGAIAPAPAIADAVRDAVGVKIKDLPLTAEKVWKALQSLKK